MQDMGPLLWNSYGVVAALLQEIVAVYPMLSPPTLTPNASNRVCNALALLQNIASHNETRSQFLNGLPYLSYLCHQYMLTIFITHSAYPAVPLPVPQYDDQDKAV